MKRIILLSLQLILSATLFAQTNYYKGEWTCAEKADLFTGIFQITIKNGNAVTGKLIWTFRAVDKGAADMLEMYKGKKGKMGMEYVKGSFDNSTNSIYFEGIKKKDPQMVIGMDKYTLKLSKDKKVIYGKTDSNGENNGLFYGIKMNRKKGAKEFIILRRKIR